MINITKASDITLEVMNECIHYDPDTGEIRWKVRPVSHFYSPKVGEAWNRRLAGNHWRVNKYSGYLTSTLSGVPLRGHRVAWFIFHGEWPDGFLDHIDGDKTNNRIANLRVVDPAESSKNKGKQVRNKTGINGVSFDSTRRKKPWRVYIGIKGNGTFIGGYETKAEAKKAREDAEIEHGYHTNHGQRPVIETTGRVRDRPRRSKATI